MIQYARMDSLYLPRSAAKPYARWFGASNYHITDKTLVHSCVLRQYRCITSLHLPLVSTFLASGTNIRALATLHSTDVSDNAISGSCRELIDVWPAPVCFDPSLALTEWCKVTLAYKTKHFTAERKEKAIQQLCHQHTIAIWTHHMIEMIRLSQSLPRKLP